VISLLAVLGLLIPAAPAAAASDRLPDFANHWHFKDLQNDELDGSTMASWAAPATRAGSTSSTTGRTTSTCLGPSSAVYAKGGCGTQASLSLTMGLSVGWGDPYAWRLPDQYIDITGLTAGRYRLWATADNGDRFVESNNATTPAGPISRSPGRG
jgi:hypothetical protein